MFRVTNLFSKVNKQSSIIEYGPLPTGLKIQLIFIFRDYINNITTRQRDTSIQEAIWENIDQILRREHMTHVLYSEPLYKLTSSYMVCKYFENLTAIEKELDVIQLVSINIERSGQSHSIISEYKAEQALYDINLRLQEHGVGYRYQEENIIKVPSEFTYEQAINPSLILLHQKGFEHAQQEFISAFDHFKKGPNEYEEALTDCLKSIESTIKIIATQRGWHFNESDTSKPLIALLLKEGLVPNYSESFLAGVRNTLESGAPTLRNKLGGHGKGAIQRIVDEASVQ